jgi:hypothetical protein
MGVTRERVRRLLATAATALTVAAPPVRGRFRTGSITKTFLDRRAAARRRAPAAARGLGREAPARGRPGRDRISLRQLGGDALAYQAWSFSTQDLRRQVTVALTPDFGGDTDDAVDAFLDETLGKS